MGSARGLMVGTWLAAAVDGMVEGDRDREVRGGEKRDGTTVGLVVGSLLGA